MKKKDIAFIGSVGVPNCYGGFESFLEAVAPALARDGYSVTVTCDTNKYIDKSIKWKGVHRKFIFLNANGFSSILHDTFAFLNTFATHKNIVILGVSAGIFFPIFRLLCFISGCNLIVNVDGVEWRRNKYSTFKKKFLKISDFFAQLSAKNIIIDSEGLRDYLIQRKRASAIYIAYPGEKQYIKNSDVLNFDFRFILSICRIEPENNCDLLIQGFLESNYSGFYVFIGNWNSSTYGKDLFNKYHNHPKLRLFEPIYDPNIIESYRMKCDAYLHGHSVGGTNPSLVEMLFHKAPIIAYDCIFNRLTCAEDATYFTSSSDIANSIEKNAGKNFSLKENSMRYTINNIKKSYIDKFL